MFGVSSFETNPSLDEGLELGNDHDGQLGSAFGATEANGRNSTNRSRSQNAAEVDDELTAASNTSHKSDAEPSFFIIPPNENCVFRDQQRTLPWERVSCAKNGTVKRSSGEATPGSILSVTYNRFGAYRRDRLIKDIDACGESGSDGYAAILKTLKRAGILIFIVDSKVSGSIADIMDSIQNVITHTRKLQRESTHSIDCENNVDLGKIPRAVYSVSSKNQWCLLYRDLDGRLFNLTLAPHTAVLAETWEKLLQSFSVLQAVSILMVLARSFSCFTSGTQFQVRFSSLKNFVFGPFDLTDSFNFIV
jgi:hypothetical protein